MAHRILIVDPDSAAVAVAVRVLAKAGYRVAPVGSFDEAMRQVASDCPDLLVSALRLGAFNGLHVLFRCRAVYSAMPVVIVGAVRDHSPDIERYGARFLPSPVDSASLLASISELLAGRAPRDPFGVRCWRRKRAIIDAFVLDSSVRVLDISYGGVRLELPSPPQALRTPIDIKLPTLGLSFKIVPRWAKQMEGGGAWWCGAEVALPGSDATRHWRWLVDSLN
jgi:DNA-binding response OmpR family regulator